MRLSASADRAMVIPHEMGLLDAAAPASAPAGAAAPVSLAAAAAAFVSLAVIDGLEATSQGVASLLAYATTLSPLVSIMKLMFFASATFIGSRVTLTCAVIVVMVLPSWNASGRHCAHSILSMETKSFPKMSEHAVSFVWLTSGMTVIHVFVALLTLAQIGASAKGSGPVALPAAAAAPSSSWSSLLPEEEEEEEEEEEDDPPLDEDDDEDEEEDDDDDEEEEEEDDEVVAPCCTMLESDPWKVGVMLHDHVVAVVQYTAPDVTHACWFAAHTGHW